jgi:hypothetical protein
MACWTLAAVLLGCLGPAAVRAGAAGDAPTATDVALRRLASPLQRERRLALHRLVALLPGDRAAVVAALPSARWDVQLLLVEVLSRDGSPDAIRALLAHLVRTDETQALRIRLSLARDDDARPRLLKAWREDPGHFADVASASPRGARRIRELVHVLRRGEIERKFVARKSRSGSTGYYKGQYDVLRGKGLEKGYRKQALEVVTGVALDEAVPTAGLYPSGVYRFLHQHTVDEVELRDMALNAVAELCTPADATIVARLEAHLATAKVKTLRLEARLQKLMRQMGWSWKATQDAMVDLDDAVGEELDELACLYQILPDRYDVEVRLFLQRLRDLDPYLIRPDAYAAALLIRVGWYEDAIRAYDLDMRSGSRALGYYNQACAYASWSRKVGLSPAQHDALVEQGIAHLEMSAQYGWSDVQWMDEDRDLDPLRKYRRARYDALVARIRRKLRLPPK